MTELGPESMPSVMARKLTSNSRQAWGDALKRFHSESRLGKLLIIRSSIFGGSSSSDADPCRAFSITSSGLMIVYAGEGTSGEEVRMCAT